MTYDEMVLEVEKTVIKAEQANRKLERVFLSFPESIKADILASLREKHPDFEVLRKF